jgi:phosphoribosylaminoimidazole-succinocarboxamide synthase
MKLLHAGSVKSIFEAEQPEQLVFEFSDRYSVFDWGCMPDLLERKGEALAVMANTFFEELNKRGIVHHALGLLNNRSLIVKKVDVPRLNPAAYAERPVHTLVPLEVLFRFGIPEGSSLVERSHDKLVQADLGLKGPVHVGDRFDRPLIEFSTKLEPTDRMLSYNEARELACLTDQEWTGLMSLTGTIALELKNIFQGIEVELWDGKIELAFANLVEGQRRFVLVDSIGPDELRLISHGVSLSKENLRQFYRRTPWYAAQLEAKKLARERGGDWKKICAEELKQVPIMLPLHFKEDIEAMYQVLADELLVFQGKPRHFCPNDSLKQWATRERPSCE